MATTKEVEKGHEKEDLLFDGYVKPYQKDKNSKCCTCSRKAAIIIAVIIVMLLLYALGLGIGLAVGLKAKKDKEAENKSTPTSTPSLVISEDLVKRNRRGAVVTDHEDCSHVGMAIMKQGGSAVDAAIAALLCNGVRQPHSMGIGGGCFMVVYDRYKKKAIAIDGRETAPMAATQKIISEIPGYFGAKSIAVPHELRAYKAAHVRYGHLPWKYLFLPSIQMAENHTLSEATAKALEYLKVRGLKLANNARLCEIFCDDEGKPKKAGDYVQMPKLAETLRKIADDGIEYLYGSDV